jgi:hypothetical protein
MYHSLQNLDLAHELARERAQQARSTPASGRAKARVLRLIAGKRPRLAAAPPRYA